MDARLLDLLRNTRVDGSNERSAFHFSQGRGLMNSDNKFGIGGDSRPYTHLSMYGPHERWNIAQNKLAEFWRGYCDIVYQGNGNYSLAERPQEHMPVIYECKLQFDGLNTETSILYDEDFLIAMVYCAQQIILESLQVSDQYGELICIVLEAERHWVEENLLTTQFRLQFPYCKTDVPTQLRILRPRFIQRLRTLNVFSRLPCQPTKDWEQIIDPINLQQPILMYKSTSQPDRPKLVLNYIFGPIAHEQYESGEYEHLELEDVFRPTNHLHFQQDLISPAIFNDQEDIHYWIPFFTSVNYWTKVTLPKPDLLSTSASTLPSPASTTSSFKFGFHGTEEDPIDIAERLLPMLSRERVERDHYWLDVGKALYTSDKGGIRGLNLWIGFTEQANIHTRKECEDLYPNFRDNNYITIKTLAWYAKEDSPEAYNAWHKAWCLPAMENALSLLHEDVAAAVYRVYWLDYIAASMDQKQWYVFRGHRWVKLDQGVELRKELSGAFLQRYVEIRTTMSQRVQESADDKDRDFGNVLIKKVCELIKKLKTVTFKTNIMRAVMEYFHDENFLRIIDTNPDLLGMLDCVIDVSGKQAIARPGKPEDYISLCTGLPYLRHLTWEAPLVKKLMTWMRQIFVDDDLRHYFLKMSASCLKGKNADKIFPIWTGEGDNSKSMLVKLFEACFGVYCIKFPTSTLTGKRSQSSAPTPEMARSKSTRVAFLQEPDDDEVIRGGLLKELTGGDSFFARYLHDNGGEVQAMFKLILMCNKVPSIPTGGKAVKNRTRIIPFLSTWVVNPPPTEEEQYSRRLFKMDPFFDRQIPDLAKAFMWVLVEYYPKYISEGLQEPAIIAQATENYWQDNDIYQQFITEYIVRATRPNPETGELEPDTNATLTHGDVYREFKNWFRESFPGAKCPDSPTVKLELVARLGKQQNRRWTGIRLAQRDNGINLAFI